MHMRRAVKPTHSENTSTLVDPARKRSGLLYTGPGTTRARLPASRFASLLSPARGRRRHRMCTLKRRYRSSRPTSRVNQYGMLLLSCKEDQCARQCHMLLLSPERRRQSLGSAGIHFR